jgi:hypothetical protein
MSIKFETHGVLSASTGILMGDIGALYAVASYLLDRPAFSSGTHELAYYGERMQKALVFCHPHLPSEAPDGTWMRVRDDFIVKNGSQMELDGALKGALADDKDPITTLREMGFKVRIITA